MEEKNSNGLKGQETMNKNKILRKKEKTYHIIEYKKTSTEIFYRATERKR